VIDNAIQLYVGSIVMFDASTGYLKKKVAGSGTIALGVTVQGGIPGSNPILDGYNLQSLPIPQIAPGNVSTAPAGAANQAIVEMGAFTWMQVTLTLANGSLNGTVVDQGTKVYTPSDNIADATNTQTSTDHPIGTITKFYSATTTTAIYDIFTDSYDARSRGN